MEIDFPPLEVLVGMLIWMDLLYNGFVYLTRIPVSNLITMNPSFEEYLHPNLYDLENPYEEQDGAFIMSYAQALGGDVLDLGCGTGRMTIPLAQAGFSCTGVEVVSEMLNIARQRSAGLPVHWVQADARSFDLGKRFMLIFECGCVFMHQLTNTDQLDFLTCVHNHLAEGGRFIFSLKFPHPDIFDRVDDEKEWYTYPDGQGRTVRVCGTEWYDELTQIKTETAIRHILDRDGNEIERIVAPLQLRYTFPREILGLLDRAGFEVKETFGGLDRSPLTAESGDMVFICSLK